MVQYWCRSAGIETLIQPPCHRAGTGSWLVNEPGQPSNADRQATSETSQSDTRCSAQKRWRHIIEGQTRKRCVLASRGRASAQATRGWREDEPATIPQGERYRNPLGTTRTSARAAGDGGRCILCATSMWLSLRRPLRAPQPVWVEGRRQLADSERPWVRSPCLPSPCGCGVVGWGGVLGDMLAFVRWPAEGALSRARRRPREPPPGGGEE